MPDTLQILLIGDTQRDEFRAARADIEACGRVTAVANVADAVRLLADGSTLPDLILLVQAYPGQYDPAAVERLRQLAPLARLVALLGSWCEGEPRTGKPLPGVLRAYWHQWSAVGPPQLARLVRGEPCAWSLPPTASDEERLLADLAEPCLPHPGLVAVYSRNPAQADWLVDALHAAGRTAMALRWPLPARFTNVAAALFDGSDFHPAEQAEFERLAAAVAPAPITVLLNFPRAHEVAAAKRLGAARVLSKPLAGSWM